VLDPATAALGNNASYLGLTESVTVVDDYTVRITQKSVNAPFLASLSSLYAAIVDREAVERYGSLQRADGGTGPYILGEWLPDNMVQVTRFDDYYRGAPKFAAIEYYTMTDSSARLAALRTGSVDIINADTAMLPLVKNDRNVNVVSYQSRNYSALVVNTLKKEFSDPRVRQAISLAINRREIIDLAYNGEAEIAGFVPASLGHWAVDVRNHPLYQQDLARARQLMADAGYAAGFEATVIVGLLDTLRDMGAVLQQQLAAINIRVNVVNKENAEYIALWSAHDFEMMVCQNGAGSDPSRGVAFFFKTGAGANIAGYSNARVDELCDLGAGTSDTARREAYYKEAINIILEDCPNIVVASPREYFLTSPRVKGFTPSASTPYALYKVSF